jgi:outer membrane autotransporter protein
MTTQLRGMLLGTTAAFLFGSTAHATPVTNADFETGDLTGWTASCPAGGCVAADGLGNPGFGFEGYNNDAAPGTLSQTLVNSPGIYRVEYDYENDCGGECGSNSLAVQFGTNAPVFADVSVTDVYRTATEVFATNTANSLLQFQYITAPGTGTLNIDNVQVTLVDDWQGSNIAAASQTVAVQSSRDFLDRLQSRFAHAGSPIQTASVRETVLASADGATYVNAGGKYRAFMNVFGGHGEWNSNATEADRRGLSAGVEMAAGSGLDVGVALAFSRSDFDTKTAATANSGDAYEYLGALYAHWSATPNLFVNAALGYGASTNDFSRVNAFGSAVASDVGSDQWFASLEAGWDWAVKGGTLTPYVRLDAAMLDQDGYTETATGLLVPATVSGQDFDSLRSIVGLRATTGIPSIGRYGATLGGKIGWAHEFERDRLVAATQTVGLVTFASVLGAAQPSQDSVVAGANLEFSLGGGSSFYAGYDGNFGGNQTVHAGEAGVRITW